MRKMFNFWLVFVGLVTLSNGLLNYTAVGKWMKCETSATSCANYCSSFGLQCVNAGVPSDLCNKTNSSYGLFRNEWYPGITVPATQCYSASFCSSTTEKDWFHGTWSVSSVCKSVWNLFCFCAPPDSCFNGLLDNDETDVDCGGSHCFAKCTDGGKCNLISDCYLHSTCENRTCVYHCFNNFQDEDEIDVDCGGLNCSKCSIGQHCNSTLDCKQGLICNNNSHTCISHCDDFLVDFDESDLNCGGVDCKRCELGNRCNSFSDCNQLSFLGCYNSSCINHCIDHITDFDETDTDCGGLNNCTKCTQGKNCLQNSDCILSTVCSSNICTTPEESVTIEIIFQDLSQLNTTALEDEIEAALDAQVVIVNVIQQGNELIATIEILAITQTEAQKLGNKLINYIEVCSNIQKSSQL